ncbi:MAG: transglutaminase-like domain-containing protein [Bacillota bacterium]|nr:transglutaminase-like domain-containing protein [Bacillota bacterium]
MKINVISIILILAFLYPLIRGYIYSFSSVGLKQDITSSEADVGFIISMILGLFFLRKIFVQHDSGIYRDIYNYIPTVINITLEDKQWLLYLAVLPILILLIYEILKSFFYIINVVLVFPVLDVLEKALANKSELFRRVISAVFEIPRSICYVILLSVVFNIAAYLKVDSNFNGYLAESKLYDYICKDVIVPIANSNFAKEIPNIINNSMKIEVRQASDSSEGTSGTIVYYNGVTLEEGIKSDAEIDNMARKLTAGAKSDNEKARILYDWVGKNIQYDDAKAERILNNDFSTKSGAITAFNERKGICFDYSCLYVAMCRAIDIKVRLITGEGFNGVSWVSHAWNQAYVNGKWVNVDTTFYKGGNYYNSSRFNLDHRNASMAGEW